MARSTLFVETSTSCEASLLQTEYTCLNNYLAREGEMHNEDYGDDLHKLYPIVEEGMTDSGSLDNVMEFLVYAGNRSLPEAAMTMVPEGNFTF